MNATDSPTSCPDCGSTDVVEVLRDGPPDTRHAFGHWLVCQSCGREWRADKDPKGGQPV
jgi:hypothetical protein